MAPVTVCTIVARYSLDDFFFSFFAVNGTTTKKLPSRKGWSPRLRPRLLYKNKSMYVGVALVNLVLRFLWTVTLVPENAPNLFPKDFQIYLSPFIAAAEIVRR